MANGASKIATAQVSVDTTSGGKLIAAQRTGRQSITITNAGTTIVYIGNSGLTTGTGEYLAGVAGASITLLTTAAIYGIVGSSTQTVTVREEYD